MPANERRLFAVVCGCECGCGSWSPVLDSSPVRDHRTLVCRRVDSIFAIWRWAYTSVGGVHSTGFIGRDPDDTAFAGCRGDRKLFQVPNRILPKNNSHSTSGAQWTEKQKGKEKRSGKVHHNKGKMANWLANWQQTAALSLKLLADFFPSVFFVVWLYRKFWIWLSTIWFHQFFKRAARHI